MKLKLSILVLALGGHTVFAQMVIQLGQPVYANYLAANAALTNVSVTGGITLSPATGSMPTSTNAAYLSTVTDAAGTLEVVTKDGAGTIHQFSEHNMDAPSSIIDTNDPFPNISMERNDYFGIVRWINRSREAMIVNLVLQVEANSYESWIAIHSATNLLILQNQAWTTNDLVNYEHSPMAAAWFRADTNFITLQASSMVVTTNETYAQYNARLGLTTNSPGYLRTNSWSADTGGQGMPLWMQQRGAIP